MPHKRIIYGWLAVLVVALNAAGASAPGYLPVVGPPELRFEEPAAPKLRPVLPPMVMLGTNPPPTNNVAVTTPDSPTTIESPGIISSNGIAPVVVVVQVTNEPPVLLVEPVPLSPQMFMPYFTRGVGTNGSAVSVPMTFLPPAPLGPPPSSTVSYEVTPANPPAAPAGAPKAAPHPEPGIKH